MPPLFCSLPMAQSEWLRSREQITNVDLGKCWLEGQAGAATTESTVDVPPKAKKKTVSATTETLAHLCSFLPYSNREKMEVA